MSKAIDLSLLEGSLLSDREALLKKAKRIASRQADGLPVDKLHGDWSQQLQRSQAIVEARKAVALNLDIPPNLPLAEFAEDIRSAVERHQIVIVAGETGSGKTTQLPKLCLSLQRGIYARIAHTQPRRLAAKTVARRLAAELGQPLGEVVGYQVRFDECLDSQARVSVMTDGLLLAQLQRDPLLLAYDTIILDEAHERSLNIDFLLGCLRKILTRRSDLKLIVTSATVDVQRFYHYFSEPQQGLPALDVAAPITVPGRRFPIDTVYLVDDEESMPSDESDSVASSSRGEQNDVEQWAQQLSAVFDDIERRERAQPETARGPRDILFFLPGEREIRELRKLLSGRFRYIDVLPLYARLGRGDQERVFGEANESRPRRVILATNIA
ncbi:DEAD/DEAH box helicase, partial [bacterium]|nr:DEAD/DEAH box helicase [bacterium]